MSNRTLDGWTDGDSLAHSCPRCGTTIPESDVWGACPGCDASYDDRAAEASA